MGAEPGLERRRADGACTPAVSWLLCHTPALKIFLSKVNVSFTSSALGEGHIFRGDILKGEHKRKF